MRLGLLQRDELNIDRMSTNAGDITIMVQREPGGFAAVAVETGHVVRKSLRRMIRRCARPAGRESDRAAAVDAVLRPLAAAAPVAVSGEEDPDDDGDIAYWPKKPAPLAEDAAPIDAAAAFGV